MIVSFKAAGIVNNLDAIRDEFTAIGKYRQNSRSADEVIVSCSADLSAPEQSDIIAWGEALGYVVTVTP